MILWTLKKFMGILIGRVPEKDRGKYWIAFNSLMAEIVRAGARGAVEGRHQ